MLDTANIDMKLLAEQKQLLLEYIWNIDEQDKRYKLWGLVHMIDSIQDRAESICTCTVYETCDYCIDKGVFDTPRHTEER